MLPKIYALPSLDKQRLGELIDLISGIGLGSKEHRDKDTLGRVYEYFLSRFASAEGKGGGEFYTPQSVVRVLVEILEPYKGRVYDPCCGSGGVFVQSLKFIEAHDSRRDQLTIWPRAPTGMVGPLAQARLATTLSAANPPGLCRKARSLSAGLSLSCARRRRRYGPRPRSPLSLDGDGKTLVTWNFGFDESGYFL